ncbi:Carbohydrate binding module (family 6) [Fibrobacter sp. UWCM]|uniref:family 43 glycosylhydrolase n=1 Tax=Fibrobacter sp. UWCM TaxID=1896208 RepID=UPI000921AAE5|nr:family 43 glycosylhydrolase [Fibrobacter sp. UWCM]SHG34038.1 Carbohydrate binding module (family 6) [Fibrobacter sp. UWCM]
MNVWKSVGALCLGAGLATFGLADNPISSYHYLADPSCASDGDTFYILTDVDDYNNQTNWNYDIVGLYAFTSEDMKNWTDHGMIFRSKREFGNYPNNTWASGIAVKNGKVYIVYPDGASGVGMITAPAIDGPYIDPVKETHGVNRIAGGGSSVIGGCDGIAHCFDPGIFFDDDGTGYVIFGGGESSQRPYGNNFDIIKFTESNGKITMDKNSLTRVQLPNSFEAPYLHKKGSTYYLSFNNRSQIIDYGTSNKIMGPYNYVGQVIPGIGSVPDAHGEGGNNHHGFAPFKDKWYAVYHDRRLVTSDNHPAATTQAGVRSENPNYENHRSVSIDELTWNGDKMNKLTFTREGPKQIKNFDPYRTYKATTSSKQMNIRSRTDWTKGQPVKHVLLPLTSRSESWIRVSGVDFGNGAENLRIKAANVGDGNKIEIRKGSATGTLAGTCELAKTSNNMTFTDNDCAMTGLTGVVDQLFFVFKNNGKDSTMGVLEWEFQGTKREPEPQQPFGGKVWAIPGKIQAEDFDVPGYGAGNDSYSDNDSENHGFEKAKSAADSAKVNYRKDDAPFVDLYANATGIIVGYNQSGEWLEYTVDVAKTGDYTFFAAVATDNQNAGFVMSVDGKDITDTILAAKTDVEGNFDDYAKVQRNVTLTAGEHILRMTVTGDWFDIDYFTFVEGKDATDPEPIGTTAISNGIKFHVSSAATYQVFDLAGTMLGKVELASGASAVQVLKAAGYRQGAYMLKQVNGNKKFMARVTK